VTGKLQQAREPLAPMYSCEGFDTRDLKEAKALLVTADRSRGLLRSRWPGSSPPAPPSIGHTISAGTTPSARPIPRAPHAKG